MLPGRCSTLLYLKSMVRNLRFVAVDNEVGTELLDVFKAVDLIRFTYQHPCKYKNKFNFFWKGLLAVSTSLHTTSSSLKIVT